MLPKTYLRGIYAFVYRQTHNIARSPIGAFEIVLWPLLSLFSIGFLGAFVDTAYGSTEFVRFILLGQCAWSFVYVIQTGLSYGLMHELWSGTLIDTMASPIDERQFIIGNGLAGVLKGLIVLAVMGVFSFFGFAVNIFSGNLIVLILILFSFCLTAVSLGLIVLTLIFYFGQEAQVMAWTITGVIVLFSGIFYPVTILPMLIQPISWSIPLTYALIAWREVTLNGIGMADLTVLLIQMYISTVLWLAVSWYACLYSIKRARKIGMIAWLAR